jgi:hypothetical protein
MPSSGLHLVRRSWIGRRKHKTSSKLDGIVTVGGSGNFWALLWRDLPDKLRSLYDLLQNESIAIALRNETI